MKALLSITVGGPETLQLSEISEPVFGADEVLIRVEAVGINYPDALIIEDRYQVKAARPFAPGAEFSGVVEAAGAQVAMLAPGMRVAGLAPYGALAEKVVASAVKIIPIPDTMPYETAAALFLTYGTAIHALIDRASLRAGQTMLVLGAAGGVGLAAVELGKAFGARVVAGVSSPEKADAAHEAGADDVLIYPRGPLDREESRSLAARFKAAVGPDGAQIVFDPVGGSYAEPALRAIAWDGHYLVVGFTAGIAAMPMNLILLKACRMIGVLWGGDLMHRPNSLQDHARTLFGLWREGKISPMISDRFSLARGGEAIARMSARGAIGKLVVQVA